jgi:hypothetical protein
VQATGEAFSHQKRTSGTSKMKFMKCFLFFGVIYAIESGSTTLVDTLQYGSPDAAVLRNIKHCNREPRGK